MRRVACSRGGGALELPAVEPACLPASPRLPLQPGAPDVTPPWCYYLHRRRCRITFFVIRQSGSQITLKDHVSVGQAGWIAVCFAAAAALASWGWQVWVVRRRVGQDLKEWEDAMAAAEVADAAEAVRVAAEASNRGRSGGGDGSQGSRGRGGATVWVWLGHAGQLAVWHSRSVCSAAHSPTCKHWHAPAIAWHLSKWFPAFSNPAAGDPGAGPSNSDQAGGSLDAEGSETAEQQRFHESKVRVDCIA